MTQRRDRESRFGTAASWPLLLLVAVMAVMSVAAYQAQDAVRSHRRTAVRLVRDYASFGAWTFAQRAGSAMQETAWRVLGPIQHRYVHQDLNIPDAGLLARYYDRSFDDKSTVRHPPSSYFGFMLGTDTLRVVGDSLEPAMRRWVHDTIEATSRGRSAIDDPETYLFARIGGRARLIAFALMPTRFGPIAYGFSLDSAQLAGMLGDVVDHATLLPPSLSLGLRNRDILALQLMAPDGTPMFVSGNWPGPTDLQAADVLPPEMAGMHVLASLGTETAPNLIIGGLPRSRLPLIAVLLILSLALAAVAVAQLRREQALARLRANFVASVSHELRTPLAQIRLYLETLRLGRFVTEEQREWSLSTIDRETRRLTNLVENVLRFAAPGRRGAPAAWAQSLAPIDLSVEVAEVAREFEVMAAARRARLECALEPGLEVRAERGAVRQVLLNLLDNAVKFGPPGQTVRLRVERCGAMVRLTVDDEGPGVSRDECESVFAPFHRGESKAAAAVGGSGIGLAVVRDLVEAHGGRVRVEPAPGRGARFVVELPAAPERTPAGPDAGGAAPSAVSGTGSHEPAAGPTEHGVPSILE